MDRDPLLRHIERNALVWCGGVTLIALVVQRGRPDVALGVLAGGALIWVSYWAIKSAIDGLLKIGGAGAQSSLAPDAGVAERRMAMRHIAVALVKLAGRYALLGFLAYVMIARLRLHPIGLLAGASSLVAGAAFEAVRAANIPRQQG